MSSKFGMSRTRYFGTILTVVLALSFTMAGSGLCKDLRVDWIGNPLVKTDDGLVQGYEDANNTLVWKAIPYAAPPVGDLRWQAPASPMSWEGVRAETNFSAWCPQLVMKDPFYVLGSEDCLYLNVWRPATEEKNLPVFVWIHGGANSLGSAAQDSYNGAYFADHNNVVYVSINYRLGPMGWFAHPALREDMPECSPKDKVCNREARAIAKNNSGNYGTLDMIRALEWVRENIKAFGGNIDNVTIAGESAGAHNVMSLMLSPLAEGLFHKAIAMSAPNRPGFSMDVADASANQVLARLLVTDGLAASEEDAYVVINAMSDADIEDYFRSKTAAELIAQYDTMSDAFTMLTIPTILTDGTVIVAEGSQAFEDGTYPGKVPAIIGSTKDEMKLFLAPSLQAVEVYFQSLGFPQGAGYTLTAKYLSDLWRAGGTNSIVRDMVAQPDQPDVFSLKFMWGANPAVVNPQWAFVFGAHHFRDVEFFLGNPGTIDASFRIDPPMSSEANLLGREALTDTIVDYVGNFMRTGDPNGYGLPAWPAWSNTAGDPKFITLDADLTNVVIGVSAEDLTEEGILNEMNYIFGPQITQFIMSFSII